ncbi:hypothetical protein HK097_004700, partial [Rhizophlyctis rosea]
MTECLKLFHDLLQISTTLPIPFLSHFFRTFNPHQSKHLASSIIHFHLRDLESADYRSAYHLMIDWFYGWNVTDVGGGANKGQGLPNGEGGSAVGGEAAGKGEAFRMHRAPRDIHIEESGERNECERILGTFETLFSTSRRVLKKQYMGVEEMVPRIGTSFAGKAKVGAASG